MSISRKSLHPDSESLEAKAPIQRVALLKNPRFQPIKTADERHHSMVVVNKNFLPLLLNPTDDMTIVRREALTPKGTILVQAVGRKKVDEKLIKPDPETGLKKYNDCDDWQEAHIPTRIEYQIFLGILALAWKEGTHQIRLDSWRSLLEHLGLEVKGQNLDLVKRTLQSFFNLVITFHETYLENAPLKNNASSYKPSWYYRQYFVISGFGHMKDSRGRVSGIHIDIDLGFFIECDLAKFVQRVDVTKVMKFKSSQALSLYLYMLRWCEKIKDKGNHVVYTRVQPEEIDFLYDYLGWKRPEPYMEDGSVNQLAQPSRVKRLINKAIAEIKMIDDRFDFYLDESLFKGGKVKFVFPDPDLIESNY